MDPPILSADLQSSALDVAVEGTSLPSRDSGYLSPPPELGDLAGLSLLAKLFPIVDLSLMMESLDEVKFVRKARLR